MPNNQLFQRAEAKYLDGTPLSPAELECMASALCSRNLRTATIACGALLRDPHAQPEQKTLARSLLQRLCTMFSDESVKNELSITLLLVPFQDLNDKVVTQFIYGLMKSERFTLRANAVVLLARLASQGDTLALSLLRSAAQDSNDTVRKSATATLKKFHP